MTERRLTQILISLLGIIFILGHILLPDIKIDSVTVFLIVIVILPWLAPVFKSLELPGGIKVEYSEIEKATKKLEDSGLIKPIDSQLEIKAHSKYSFLNVVDIDSNLALSGLRMEIESRLKDLATTNKIDINKLGITQITRKLEQYGILNKMESEAILSVLPILNKAVHGDSIDKVTHMWAIDVGPQILDNLQARIGAQKLPDLINSYKNRDGAQFLELGPELSKQLIRTTESFFEHIKKEREVFIQWLEELETSTFTLYEASDEIEEELAYAKYSKLKEMMIKRVTEYLDNNKNDSDAIQILEKLKEIKIKSVW